MARYEAIVIGVSAGGLQALSILIPSLPENFAVPVLIVLHRKAERDSFLEEHLDGLSQVKVRVAKPNDILEPGKVYMAPGGYHLMVERGNILALSIDPPVCFSLPSIDVLFESAADVYQEKLIGVILTGANSDGSDGLKKIRALGGLGVVQDPETADAPTMPESAISVAGADHILPLDEIGSFLTEIIRGT